MKTFILRIETDEMGGVVGVVERVRNGEKERFLGYGMLIEIVGRMMAADDVPPPRTINAQELRQPCR